MTLPSLWAAGGLVAYAGKVRFRRRFGYPGCIDGDERVWLTCFGIAGRADVSLNTQPLGLLPDPQGRLEFEITHLLKERNELQIDVEGGADGGIWGEVALEVRRTAYLRGVEFSLTGGRLQLSGEVVGTAARPLELYALLGRSTIAYGLASAGSRFTLDSEPILLQGRHSLRLDLVDGAIVWYTLERVIDIPGESETSSPEAPSR